MSFYISLKKGIRDLAIFGIPVLLDIFLRSNHPWLGLTVGGIIKFVIDAIKHRAK